MNTAQLEKQRPEAEQESIKYQKIGCALPRASNNQVLLFPEKTVSNYSPGSSSLAIVVKRCARSTSRSLMAEKRREGFLQEQDYLNYCFQVIFNNFPWTPKEFLKLHDPGSRPADFL